MILFPRKGEEDTKLTRQSRCQLFQPRFISNQLPLHRLHTRREKARPPPLTFENNGQIGTGAAIGAAGTVHGPGQAGTGPTRTGRRQAMLFTSHTFHFTLYLEESATFGIN